MDPAAFQLPCVCATVRRVSRVLSQLYDDALRPAGLRATQFHILMTIHHLGEAQLSELEPRLSLDQTTLTRSLRLLEADGLLVRAASQDRRVKRLRLSPKGSRTLQKAIPLWTAIQTALLDRLGPNLWAATEPQLRHILHTATESLNPPRASRAGGSTSD